MSFSTKSDAVKNYLRQETSVILAAGIRVSLRVEVTDNATSQALWTWLHWAT